MHLYPMQIRMPLQITGCIVVPSLAHSASGRDRSPPPFPIPSAPLGLNRGNS
jgi:hypothetical protein